MDHQPTRAAALEHLATVLPRLGRPYASGRNVDAGPDEAPTTSVLSPYLRRRLLLESEAVAAAREAHGAGAQRFVEEVFWRTYFKGYLETHPTVWADHRRQVDEERARLDGDAGLAAAEAGRTGIEGFDDWARQLTETGWLHNHVRMWFASIWIFTLRLPWSLGADFFMRHLLDGDPASNTLNWRWVAGLHTRGRHYVARRSNIERCTRGRFAPAGLDESPQPLVEEARHLVQPLARAGRAPAGEVALLLHVDDLHPESWPLEGATVRRVAGLVAHAPGASAMVRAADEAAMADALARAASFFGCPVGDADGLPVVTAWAPVGPSANALPPACVPVRCAWDDAAWKHATRGYFGLRSRIGEILNTDPAR